MYIVMSNSTQTVEGSYVHCNAQQYTDRQWRVLMYIVMCNSTQTVEGSYVHCNEQQYTDSGGFLCTLQCITVHR
jgi:predicted small secreted protein